ncbi:MAG: hypothetical protein IGBAC_0028 [Ignavibacteriae bacterium]|nr:MAG: hypothetical protein IGBAC_0028 [Ignavibacteriota bacterium]
MKLINVKVVANSKKEEVQKFGDGLKVYLRAPAIEGKANKALIEVLSHYFNVSKSQIEIIKGEKSKVKIVAVK